MISKILFSIFKGVAVFCLNWIYNFIDTDNDGVIEEEEVEALTTRIKQIIGKK